MSQYKGFISSPNENFSPKDSVRVLERSERMRRRKLQYIGRSRADILEGHDEHYERLSTLNDELHVYHEIDPGVI